MDLKMLEKAQEAARHVLFEDRIKEYTVNLVRATRFPQEYGCEDLAKFIEAGASVRASINLIKVAKARALIEGRTHAQAPASK